MTSTTSTQHLVVRRATAGDIAPLDELAALDGTRVGAGPHVVVELDGRLVAAVSLTDGLAIADPFTPTAALVDLLRAHTGRDRVGRPRRMPRLRRRPRTAPAF